MFLQIQLQPEGLSIIQLGNLIESEPDEKDEAKPKKKKSKKKGPEEEEEEKEESPVEEEVNTYPLTQQPILKENPAIVICWIIFYTKQITHQNLSDSTIPYFKISG